MSHMVFIWGIEYGEMVLGVVRQIGRNGVDEQSTVTMNAT